VAMEAKPVKADGGAPAMPTGGTPPAPIVP
jgi:hypothetical protein